MPAEDIQGSVIRWLSGEDAAFEAVFLYYRPRLLMNGCQWANFEAYEATLTDTE